MNATTIETDSTRTVRDTVRGSKEQPKAGIKGALRRLFRQAVKAVTGRDPAPVPTKSKRRGSEDTGRRFTKAAHRLTHWRAGTFAAVLWLADTLDWLNLWHPGGTDPTDDLSQGPPNNHLSPRL